jgi:hypothetical protein
MGKTIFPNGFIRFRSQTDKSVGGVLLVAANPTIEIVG